jgi:hypothetical protein
MGRAIRLAGLARRVPGASSRRLEISGAFTELGLKFTTSYYLTRWPTYLSNPGMLGHYVKCLIYSEYVSVLMPHFIVLGGTKISGADVRDQNGIVLCSNNGYFWVLI